MKQTMKDKAKSQDDGLRYGKFIKIIKSLDHEKHTPMICYEKEKDGELHEYNERPALGIELWWPTFKTALAAYEECLSKPLPEAPIRNK